MTVRKMVVAAGLTAVLLATAGCGSAEPEKTPKITGGSAKFDPNERPAGRGAPGAGPVGKGGGSVTAQGLNKK